MSVSCYNAFSRLDMRVQVTIPGTVESYCIDDRGARHEATENLWLATYLCGVLRAYTYADDGGGEMIKMILGMRRFNPITNTESEHKFLDAAERLFFKGVLGFSGLYSIPTYMACHRMAAWFRSRDPDAHRRLQSPDIWSSSLYTYNRPLCFWHESLREATDS